MRRRDFIGAVSLAAIGARAASGAQTRPSRVNRWVVITIGNLSRNRYWGESEAKAVREVVCTCTLLSGEAFHLLVDPSLAGKADMAKELDRRTGLKLDDITAVFLTHEHKDHFAGMEHFPKARWFAGAATADIMNSRQLLTRKLQVAPKMLFDAVEVFATPGHTASHQSLRFNWEGQSVVVAGDAVATGDFWRERRVFFNAVDAAQAGRTMEELAKLARIVVPGHDNYFLV